MEKIYTLSGSRLKEKILNKEISAQEATQAVIDRINATDESLQAYNTYNFDAALEKAKKVDEKISKGEKVGKLAGIPVAVSDMILTKDLLTTAGSKMMYNYNSVSDAVAIEKLLGEDAVIIGKTACDEFGMGLTGENTAFKKSRNPWDLSRVPGGSSSGSAATVAGCQVPMALASDTGGSIRIPASYTGIVGLKPTYGTVSRNGLIAYGSSIDQIGSMARTVDDSALLFESICGKDGMDATSKEYAFKGYGRDVKGLKVGLPKEYFGDDVSADVKESIFKAVEVLKGLGAEIIDVSLPSAKFATNAYYIIACAEASSNLGRYDGMKYGYPGSDWSSYENIYLSSRTEGFGAEVQKRVLFGTLVLSAGFYDKYFKRAKLVRKQIAGEFKAAFEKCDVMITPVTRTTAPKFGEKSYDDLKTYDDARFTARASLAGLPGISLPCGLGAGELPIGLQVIGNKFDESTLLTVAKCYENAVGGFEIKEF